MPPQINNIKKALNALNELENMRFQQIMKDSFFHFFVVLILHIEK